MAHSEEEMISASLRLIEDASLREELRDYLVNNDYAKPLFLGQESVFCDYFVDTQKGHPIRLINEPKNVV